MSFKDGVKNRIMVLDGAMGTYFAAKRSDYAKPCELANIDMPNTVKDIHMAYINAGCDAIKTNTFMVNPMNPIYEGDLELMKNVVKAGWRIAQSAAAEASKDGKNVYVFADIGPMPAGAKGDSAAKAAAFEKVCDIFIECGAKILSLRLTAAMKA